MTRHGPLASSAFSRVWLLHRPCPSSSISSGGGIGSSGRWSGASSPWMICSTGPTPGAWRICRSSRSSWACTSAKWWRWIPRRLPAGERRRARRCWAKGQLAPGRAGGAGQHRGGRHPGRVDRWGAGRLGPAGPLWGQLRRGGGRGVRGPAAQRGPPAPRGRCGDCDPEAVCRRHGPGRADGPIAH